MAKKREQRLKKKGIDAVIPKVEVQSDQIRKCPEGVNAREWAKACERAERAKQYANKMPGFVGLGDARSQDPLWQWENEVKGRFGNVVGGSLSGSRSNPGGN